MSHSNYCILGIIELCLFRGTRKVSSKWKDLPVVLQGAIYDRSDQMVELINSLVKEEDRIC